MREESRRRQRKATGGRVVSPEAWEPRDLEEVNGTGSACPEQGASKALEDEEAHAPAGEDTRGAGRAEGKERPDDGIGEEEGAPAAWNDDSPTEALNAGRLKEAACGAAGDDPDEDGADAAAGEKVALGGPRRPDALSVVLACALVAGLACAIAGFWMLWRGEAETERYEELAQAASPAAEEAGEAETGIDWDSLRSQNPAVCAWLTVGGTSIDLPVVHASQQAPDKYLHFDFWGEASSVGCPYLNWQCDPDGLIEMVYGHNLYSPGKMFTDLGSSYEAESFQGIGAAAWSTPVKGESIFKPLCALKIDASQGAEWNKTGFDDKDSMRAWLAHAVEESGASCEGAQGMAAEAERCLVLATCDHSTSTRTKRTLTVFVEGGA